MPAWQLAGRKILRRNQPRISPRVEKAQTRSPPDCGCAPEGATSGWGGRMGDLFAAGNGSATFTCVNVSGNPVFSSVRSAVQYQVSPRGPVSLGGFDTHAGQAAVHPALLGRLAGAMRAFHDATVELGTAQQVTTFTASDFGRTPTGTDGSDRGWGAGSASAIPICWGCCRIWGGGMCGCGGWSCCDAAEATFLLLVHRHPFSRGDRFARSRRTAQASAFCPDCWRQRPARPRA